MAQWKFWIKNLWKDERGIGVVEMILILVVLIGLVIIFKSKLTTLITNIFTDITTTVNTI